MPVHLVRVGNCSDRVVLISRYLYNFPVVRQLYFKKDKSEFFKNPI